MKTIQFETKFHGESQLQIPPKIAARLPDSGKAKVILLIEEDAEDAEWRNLAYERFVREDVAMLRAIQAGEKSPLTSRKRIFQRLSGKA